MGFKKVKYLTILKYQDTSCMLPFKPGEMYICGFELLKCNHWKNGDKFSYYILHDYIQKKGKIA